MVATKEQERKTLEKIRQMVAELGTDSYLAAAFDGAFEIAEQNIENDFGCTTRYYIDEVHKAEDAKLEMAKQLSSLKEAYETVLKRESMLKTNIEELNEALMTAKREATGYKDQAESYKVMIEDLECDVMKLKAKLYDYMTGEVK